MTPLRQRMLEDMAIRNLADNTQSSYLQQISAYARYFHQAPEDLGPEEIRTYQLHLTQRQVLRHVRSLGLVTPDCFPPLDTNRN